MIELKKWEMSDIRILTDLCNSVDRSYLSNRLPSPYTENHAREWISMVQEQEGTDGIFRAILSDRRYVGNISVERGSDVGCKNAEIGYFLSSEIWSRGVMTEAVKQICETAFQELDIIRITGAVYRPNTASRRVLEKNGFQLEGTMRNAVWKNGTIYDMYILGKLLENSQA